MARVVSSASATVSAPPERVLDLLRDYRDARPRILTREYSDYRVLQGGTGEGTVIAYHFSAGGRERDYRLRVTESPGSLTESDELSSFVTVWTVAPAPDGSLVTVQSSWNGAGGVGGVFERLFAPMGLRRIQLSVLKRLASALAQ
ncbi:MAG TPA: SRPBCC family protein [Solirubrobacteraceae bacterium]|nr:SRPBCC family protein [Solirubrobacteraceae bacterium]